MWNNIKLSSINLIESLPLKKKRKKKKSKGGRIKIFEKIITENF